MTIAQAIERTINNTISPKIMLENILSCNFSGLSDQIHFEAGKLLQTPILRIVNVVKKGYEELDFWTSESGFSESVEMKSCTKKIAGPVTWPGYLIQVLKGWAMPTKQNPLKIGVPGRSSFQKFVKVDYNGNLDNSKFDGWCIDVFKEVLKKLPYSLPYKFMPLNVTYEDLVDCVHNKVTTLDLPFSFLNLFVNFHVFHTCMTQNKQTPPLISQFVYMFTYIYELPKNFPHCLYSPSKKFLWIY